MPWTISKSSALNNLYLVLLSIALSHNFNIGIYATETTLQPRPSLQNAVEPLISTYCLDCHTGDEAEAGFNFELLLGNENINASRAAWKKVHKHIRGYTMPPQDSEQPSNEQRAEVVAWLERELNNFDCSGPQNPGHVTLRRLNRIEYKNSVRDLTGVDYNPNKTFPRDTVGYGFDNIGDVLSLSPLLIEKYLNAAETISTAAILAPESLEGPSQRYPADQLEGGSLQGNYRNLFTNGRISTQARLLTAGHYLLRVRASATQAGDEFARMQFDVDKQNLRTVEVAAEANDWQTYYSPFHAEAGTSEIGVSFLNDFWNPDAKDKSRRDRNLYVQSMEVVGPLHIFLTEDKQQSLVANPPTREAWTDSTAWKDQAKQSIRYFLTKAFRRPATKKELLQAIRLVEQARESGDSYQRAMQMVMQFALVSPNFLFRGEVQTDTSNEPANISEHQLATRLSYFLWSSTPDQLLMQHATAGTLRENLDSQLQRMLDDSRSDEFVKNFGGQWLETRLLETLEPNAELYPEFDDSLTSALQEETFLLLRDILRNDRPISTLITADYSFLNNQLAKHYQIDGVNGEQFQKVQLPVYRQAGILAHGGVLAVTSHPDRTSPVLRGKWIMQHLLNDEPPPPPVVADLAEDPQSTEGKSLRERLEIHRANPSCSVCHQVMDPLGFALENFDPLGRWRDSDGKYPIDASGQLPDGRQFSGPTGLRDILLEDLPALRKCLVEQLLIYALGRGLEYYDQCAIEQIAATALEQGDTMGAIIRAIVLSVPFQQSLAEHTP